MNVVVVVCDTLRMDDFGCYGNAEIRTPNFDRMAAEGALFQNFYSEGLPTVPTRTAFFTGRYTLPFRPWQHLEPTDRLLAEMFGAMSYKFPGLQTDHSPYLHPAIEGLRTDPGFPAVARNSILRGYRIATLKPEMLRIGQHECVV